MRVEKRPLKLVAWNAGNEVREVEVNWDEVLVFDTLALENVALTSDSVPKETPYYDEFEFNKDKVQYAKLETQLASNISPGRSATTFSTTRYYADAVEPFLAFVNATSDSHNESGRPYENFNTPISLGGGLNKRIKKRWSLGFGIVYTLMTSSSTYINEDWETRNRIRRQYLGPTVSISHEFVQRERFSMFSIAGLQHDFGLGTKILSVDYENGEKVGEVQRSIMAGRQSAVIAGLGMNYHLTPKLRLYLQGTANRYFNQMFYNLWRERRYWPNVQAGIRLGL